MAPWITTEMAPRRNHKAPINIGRRPADCITSTTLMKAEFHWIIHNFGYKCQHKKVGGFLESPFFHAPGDEDVQWYLRIFPNGERDKGGSFAAFVYAHPSPFKLGCNVRVRQYLRDENTQTELYQLADDCYDFSDGLGWGYTNLSQKRFLPVKSLRYICKLEYEVEKVETNLDGPFSGALQPAADLVTNLAEFLSSTGNSDVTFVVEGKEFPAHKAIVSARSPVFAAMFQHNMKEAAQNRVDIVDIETEIFQDLLRFMYTDQLDLTVENATGLLAAANRYFVDLLKWKCEKFLAQDLSMKNCCERLILADTQDAPNLKKAAGNIIRKSSAKLKKTESWKRMMKEASPDLLREIIESLLPP